MMGGNLYRVKPEVGRYDASYGVFFERRWNWQLFLVKPKDSGFFVDGEIRDIKKSRSGNLIICWSPAITTPAYFQNQQIMFRTISFQRFRFGVEKWFPFLGIIFFCPLRS